MDSKVSYLIFFMRETISERRSYDLMDFSLEEDYESDCMLSDEAGILLYNGLEAFI